MLEMDSAFCKMAEKSRKPKSNFFVFFFFSDVLHIVVYLFVLRFYGPVNPMGSCRAQSVYLTTRLLGRLSPLSG